MNTIFKKALNSVGLYTPEQLTKSSEFLETADEILAEGYLNKLSQPSGLAIDLKPKQTGEGTNVRKKPDQLLNMYFTNPYIFRAVNARAVELITRGYSIVGEDEVGIKKCENLIKRSGGVKFFKQLSINADVFGNGWIELCFNKKMTDLILLDLLHPSTFGYKTHKNTDKIILNSSGRPIMCEQKTVDEVGNEYTIDVPLEKVGHLTFNKIADEFVGVSLIQPIYDTTTRLMNMENSAAGAAVKAANPVWVGKADTKSLNELAKWAKVLGRIDGKEQILLPKGFEIELMSPGQQHFSEYSEYYVNEIVAGTGVPKHILLGSGDSANKATSIIQNRNFFSEIESNQDCVIEIINDIFRRYAEIGDFIPPKLVFNEIAEDINVKSAEIINLFNAGIIDLNEARAEIGLEKGDIKIGKSTDADAIKKDEMQSWHNNPGQPAGSQIGEKKKMEQDQFSEFKSDKK